MNVNINSKKVSNLISIPFLILVATGLLFMVGGIVNSLIW